MRATALGLGASVVALVWVGESDDLFLRAAAHASVFAFGGLAALHILAVLYRALSRLEQAVSRAAGGCNCAGGPRTQRSLRESK